MATNAASGVLTAASPTLELPAREAGVVGVEVSGTWTGTVTFESRVGATWQAAQVYTTTGAAASATTTTNVVLLINANGFSAVRANFSTPTSGSPAVTFVGGRGSVLATGGGGGVTAVAGTNASGTTAVGLNPVVGGINGAGALVRFLTEANAVQATTGNGLLGVGDLAQAVAHGANPTAVAAGQYSVHYANRAGIPFMIGGHPNVQTVRANYAAAQTDTALATVATGLKIVCTRLTVTASKANTVNVAVVAGFGAVNTPTTTGVLLAHPGIDPGGGVNIGGGSGILGVGADGEDLRVTCSVPTGGSIDVAASFYSIES